MLDLHILLVLMIVGAIGAMEARGLLSTIVMLGAVGLFQAVSFLVLKAPDLAIVQLAVEILSLVILLRATIGRDTSSGERRVTWGNLLLGTVCTVLVLGFVCAALASLPAFGHPIMRVASTYIEKALEQTGAANIVSSVILDYRAYDTLGEAVVLVTAVIGCLVVLRRPGRKEAEMPEEEA